MKGMVQAGLLPRLKAINARRPLAACPLLLAQGPELSAGQGEAAGMLGTPPEPCSSRGVMKFLGPYLPGAAIPQDSICFGPMVPYRRALMPWQLPGAHTSVVG